MGADAGPGPRGDPAAGQGRADQFARGGADPLREAPAQRAPGRSPIEPPPTCWDLASAEPGPDDDLVALGADLDPGTLLAAYRHGLFPMGIGPEGGPPIGWWSPVSRGVLIPADLKVSRSLRRSLRRFRVTWDQAFASVVASCAGQARSGGWITPDIAAAYVDLHRLGWAHSVEVWSGPELVGGLYGVSIGGLFAGESMFHAARDASKVALVALVAAVRADGDARRLIDVQWRTEHLASLGVSEVDRATYARLLAQALLAPHLRPPRTFVP